jgi:hypothetical protein
MLMRAFQNRNPTFTRGLSLLLLVFILYGTTVEAAHRHGRVLPATSHLTSVVQQGSSQSTLKTTPGCSDCLICQLHQNFSATLITFKPQAEKLTVQMHSRSIAPVSIRSVSTSSSPGRAPPQAN